MVRGRTSALVLVSIVMIGSVAACGRDGGLSDQELAAQDRLAAVQNRITDLQAQRVARHQRLLARRASAAVAELTRSAAQIPRLALQSLSVPADDLCTIERPATGRTQRIAQQRREQRRKRALDYLNLSCRPPW
jgi:hypothetical protein